MVHLLLVGLPTLGLVGGLVLVQRLTDSPCGIDCTYEFARLFGGIGFYSVDIPTFGVHSVVFAGFALATLVAGRTAARHSRTWRDWNGVPRSADGLASIRIAAVTHRHRSVSGLVGLSYYVNRSYAALLLVEFLPLAISSMGMLTLLVRESAPNTLSERLWLFPLIVVCLVPVLRFRGCLRWTPSGRGCPATCRPGFLPSRPNFP